MTEVQKAGRQPVDNEILLIGTAPGIDRHLPANGPVERLESQLLAAVEHIEVGIVAPFRLRLHGILGQPLHPHDPARLQPTVDLDLHLQPGSRLGHHSQPPRSVAQLYLILGPRLVTEQHPLVGQVVIEIFYVNVSCIHFHDL